MPILQHKFIAHQANPLTEILILGTFVHDRPESGEFFYGRTRNFLWHLLPIAYGQNDLKEASLELKNQFTTKYKIDFADLINSIEVEENETEIADDHFIDACALDWNNIEGLIESLPNLKAVYFTRKTFNSIPNIRARMVEIAEFCASKDIRICKLDTPSKYYDNAKQQQWRDTLVFQKGCLRIK